MKTKRFIQKDTHFAVDFSTLRPTLLKHLGHIESIIDLKTLCFNIKSLITLTNQRTAYEVVAELQQVQNNANLGPVIMAHETATGVEYQLNPFYWTTSNQRITAALRAGWVCGTHPNHVWANVDEYIAGVVLAETIADQPGTSKQKKEKVEKRLDTGKFRFVVAANIFTAYNDGSWVPYGLSN
jgi:hypothetical protein